MLKNIDRIAAVLLILRRRRTYAGLVAAYGKQPIVLLWSLCASVLVVLLGALNLLRSYRPGDPMLAWLTAAGTTCWLAASIAFGVLIGKPLDPRVLVFAVLSAVLILFSLKTAASR